MNEETRLRYVVQTVDGPLKALIANDQKLRQSVKETGTQVKQSTAVQEQAWKAVASAASAADSKVAESAISASDKVSRAVRKQVADLHKAGSTYSEISVQLRELGTSSRETAAAIQRDASKHVAAARQVENAWVRATRQIRESQHAARASGGGGLVGHLRTRESVSVPGASHVRAVASGAVGLAAGFFSAEAMKGAIDQTVQLTKETQFLGKAAGMSHRNASELAAVFQAFGLNARQANMGLKALSSTTQQALGNQALGIKPSKQAAQAFQALGITYQQVKGHAHDLNGMLNLVADGFKKAGGGPAAMAASQKLLGRSFQQIVPLLSQGSKGIAEFKHQALDMGATVGGDTTKKMLALHEAEIKLNLASIGVKTQFATQVAPTLLNVLQRVIQLAIGIAHNLHPEFVKIGQVVKQVTTWLNQHKTILLLVKVVLATLTTALVIHNLAVKAYGIYTKVVTVAAKAWAAAQWLVNAALDANPIGLVVIAIAALAAGFVLAWKHSQTFRDVVTAVFDVIKKAATTVIDFFKAHWQLLAALLLGPIAIAAIQIKNHWSEISGAATSLWHDIRSTFNTVVSFIGSLPGRIANAAKGLWDGLGSGFKSVVNDILGGFQTLVRNIGLPGFHAGPVHFGGVHPFSGFTMPHLAAGGAMSAGAALVSPGEMLVTPSGQVAHVPGARAAADNTLALAPAGTAVLTDHGQSLMAAGAPLHQALAQQLPHFQDGGILASAAGSSWQSIVNPPKKAKPKKRAGTHAKKQKILGHLGALAFAGRVSTFGPPGEASHAMASGQPSSAAGIALRHRPLGPDHKYLVTVGSHQAILPQLDWGPATSTGRTIDITGAGAQRLGLDPYAFPTGAHGKAQEWIGPSTGLFHPRKPPTFSLPRAAMLTPEQAFTQGYTIGTGRSLDTSDFVGDLSTLLPELVKGATPKQAGGGAGGVSQPVGPASGRASSRYNAMVSFANRVNAMRIPYGAAGHSGWGLNKAGEDCSSTVSKVLHAGGFLSTVMDTTRLPSALEHGAGRQVTVFDRPLAGNAGHTVIKLGSRFFGTSASNPGGGPGWIGGFSAAAANLPIKLHPRGMRSGGVIGYRSGGRIAPALRPLVSAPTMANPAPLLGHLASELSNVSHFSAAALQHLVAQIHAAGQIVRRAGGFRGQVLQRRLQAALALANAEEGRRLGIMVRNALSVTTVQEQLRTHLANQGRRAVALMKAAGKSQTDIQLATVRTQQAIDQNTLKAYRGELATLQKALGRTKNKKVRADIQAQIDKVLAAIDDMSANVADDMSAVADAVQAAADAAKQAAEDAAQSQVDIAAHGETMANAGLQNLQLQQQIAQAQGNGPTPQQAGQQQADYINQQIVPAMQAELGALQGQLDTAKQQGDTALANQVAEAIAQKTNDISQAQLDALNAVKDATQQTAENTDPLKDFSGTTAFDFGGQTNTDLLTVGVGV